MFLKITLVNAIARAYRHAPCELKSYYLSICFRALRFAFFFSTKYWATKTQIPFVYFQPEHVFWLRCSWCVCVFVCGLSVCANKCPNKSFNCLVYNGSSLASAESHWCAAQVHNTLEPLNQRLTSEELQAKSSSSVYERRALWPKFAKVLCVAQIPAG